MSVGIYSPPVVDRTANASSRCVGRERELAIVEQLFSSVLGDGRGRAACVTGPAGIGKQRVVQEAARRLRARGALVVEGRTRDGARAYQPVAEAIEGLARLLAEAGDSALSGRGADLLERLEGRDARVGHGAVDGSAKGAEDAAREEGRRLSLFEEVASLLAAASERAPLVIAIHDLHRADGATRALLSHLLQTRVPAPELDASFDRSPTAASGQRLRALMVLTSRDDETGWLDGTASTCLPLGALDDDGIRAFLQSDEVLRIVSAATGGRPSALSALVQATPPDADALAEARLSRLSPEARRLAAALSVFGKPTAPDALRRASDESARESSAAPLAGPAMARAIAELLDGGVVERIVTGGELRLGFLRAAEKDAAYARLDESERVALHLAVGRSLGARGDEADRVAVAEHLCRAGAGDEAVEAALFAAERLSAGFGYDRAIALYREAHRLTSSDEIRARIEARLVELLRLTGDYTGALSDAERLLARSPEDAATLRAIGQLHLLRDDYGRAHEALGRAREQALASGDPVELARVIAAVAETCLLDGRHADAIAECEIGLLATSGSAEDARAGQPAQYRLEIRNTLGKVHLAEGRYEIAGRLFAENLEASRRLILPFEEARSLINQGIARLRLGDDAGAAGCYQGALKVAEAAGDHRHRAFCLQNLGVLAHWRCDYDAATRYFQEAIGTFKKIGQRGRIAWVALDLASLYLDLGAGKRAAQMAALAERMAETRVAAQVRLKRAVISGRIARAAGDVDVAREHLASAHAAGAASNPEIAIEAALQLGWLDLESCDPAAAATKIEALLSPAAAALSPGTRARVRLLAGEVELASASPVPARRSLLEAAETFHRLGDLDGEWRAHFALARAASQLLDHAEADRRLRRAALVEARLRDRVPEDLREGLAADPVRRALCRSLAEADPVRASGVTAPLDVTARAPSPAPVEAGPDRFHRIIGRHPRMRQIFGLVEKIARHPSVVLIRGESGTGKELIADAIHERSPRAAHALVKVNCGALVESLLLSELFGHERGAFTGAVQRQKGRFEAAHQGTIFLDEIGDISPRTQTALLRVIQEREFERVGSTTPIKVDVRIICATNRDLESMVARGEFREDLYYRLKGIQIDLPPLRERDSDIPILVADLLRRITEERGGGPKSIAPDAMAVLARHPWPGNIRELENVIRSVSLLGEGDVIGPRDLADYPGFAGVAGMARTSETIANGGAPTAWARMGAEGIGLRELQAKIEIECITRALTESRGNITKAAELLKMKRPRLSQLIKEHGIVL